MRPRAQISSDRLLWAQRLYRFLEHPLDATRPLGFCLVWLVALGMLLGLVL